MEIREALEIIKNDFEEHMSTKSHIDKISDILQAESILIQFVSAVLNEPCDIKYNYEYHVQDDKY